jgi:hypothetical protein
MKLLLTTLDLFLKLFNLLILLQRQVKLNIEDVPFIYLSLAPLQLYFVFA